MASTFERMRASIEPWFLACALIALSTTGIVPILIPLEVVAVQGNPENVGLVMAAIGAGMLTSPFWAQLAGRTGSHRLLMVAASSGVGLAMWGFDKCRLLSQWLGFAFLIGCCVASAFTLANIIIVATNPPEEVEERISWLQTLVTVGTVAGLALAGAIEHLPFSAGVTAAAVTSLVAAVVAGTTTPKVPPSPEPIRAEPNPLDGTALPRFPRPLAAMLLMWFLSNAGISGYNALYPLVMQNEFKVRPAPASYVLALTSALSTFGFVLARSLTTRWGTMNVLFFSLLGRLVLLIALCLLAYMEFEGRQPVALTLFAGVTLLWPLICLSATSVVAGRAKNKTRALGLFDGAAAAAHLIGPVAAGILAHRFGYEAVLLLAAGTLAVSLPLRRLLT